MPLSSLYLLRCLCLITTDGGEEKNTDLESLEFQNFIEQNQPPISRHNQAKNWVKHPHQITVKIWRSFALWIIMFKLFHNDTVVSPSYIDHTLTKISNFLKVVKCHILQVYNVCGIERKFKDFLFVRTQLDLSQTCLRSVSWI